MSKEEQLEVLEHFVKKYPNGEIKIAGTQHQEHIQEIRKAQVDDPVLLVRVFGNPYDENAIDVRNCDDRMIGHFTEEDCAVLAPVLEARLIRLEGRIARIISIEEQPEGADRPNVYIRLSWKENDED
jgi:hypothetical protein